MLHGNSVQDPDTYRYTTKGNPYTVKGISHPFMDYSLEMLSIPMLHSDEKWGKQVNRGQFQTLTPLLKHPKAILIQVEGGQ